MPATKTARFPFFYLAKIKKINEKVLLMIKTIFSDFIKNIMKNY